MTDQMTDKVRRLVEEFVSVSVRDYVATELGEFAVVNSCVDRINVLVVELWREGGQCREALRALAELTKHEDPRVVTMAAVYTIEFFPEVAERLRPLVRHNSLVGLLAKQTLQNWENDRMNVLKELLES